MKYLQSGRSMVEMIGTLAIISVPDGQKAPAIHLVKI